jgi:hypothetical protein
MLHAATEAMGHLPLHLGFHELDRHDQRLDGRAKIATARCDGLQLPLGLLLC